MRDDVRARLTRGALAVLAVALVVAVLLVVLPQPGAVVLGIALGASLSRSQLERDARGRLEALLLLPVIGLVGEGLGALLRLDAWAGAVVYVVVLTGVVLLRRLGSFWRRLGSIVATPLLTVLFLPGGVGADQGPLAAVIDPLLVALLAWAAVTLVHTAAAAAGLLGRPAAREASIRHAAGLGSALQPGSGPAGRARASGTKSDTTPMPDTTPDPSRSRSSRPDATTRSAIQLGVALSVSFVVGLAVFGEHWPWVVLSTVIVAYLPRGRADALRTGLHRLVGAAAGSVVALVPLSLAPADPVLLTVLALAAIGVGILLREVGYAAWAFGVTFALVMLQSLTGQPAPLVGQRLVEIVVGVAIGLLAVSAILPVRTTDVVRSRLKDVLAAVSDRLGATDREAAQAAESRIRVSLRELDRAAVALVDAGRIVTRLGRPAPHGAQWAAEAHVLGTAAAEAPLPAAAPLRRAVGDARRALLSPDELGPALERAAALC